MAPSQTRPNFTFSKATFFYKTDKEAEWIRLPGTEDDPQHNCCGIRFDGGVVVTQKNKEHESSCHLRLILKSPTITTENDQLTVEAACVGVSSLDPSAYRSGKDKTHAIEHAKTLPIALIGNTITAIKLCDLNGSRDGVKIPEREELTELILSTIDLGFQAWIAQQQTNGPSGQSDVPKITVSKPGQTGAPPSTIISRPRQPKRLYNAPPHPSPTSSSAGSSSGTTAPPLAKKPTLEERMRAHQIEVSAGEVGLRQRLEDDRHAMIRAVTRPIAEAIDREFDRMVEVGLAEHRAKASAAMGRIVAEEGSIGK